MEHTAEGTIKRSSALSLVGATEIQSALHDQISVPIKKGTNTASSTLDGIKKTNKNMDVNVVKRPPKIEEIILNNPILFPLLSGVER